jgi:hypothetical protein
LVYVAIDTMALLSCPVGQQAQTRADFIAWVDRHLKADATSEYQYEGMDVYAARCALLHSYGSVASMHVGPNPPRKFGYMDNGPHKKNGQSRFVLVSIAVLIHDFTKAMETFVNQLRADPELKRRVDSRITGLLLTSIVG